jgi:hypothetical protein
MPNGLNILPADRDGAYHPFMPAASQEPTDKPGLKERVRGELREFAVVALYLYVCLGALLLYRTAILQEVGVPSTALGIAAAKALILAKFLLLGRAAGVGSRWHARTLLLAIARQAVLLWMFLIVLSVAEEFVVGLIHGHALAATLAAFEQHSLLEMIAKSLLLLIVLLPLVAAVEVDKALGPGVLRRALLAAESESGP